MKIPYNKFLFAAIALAVSSLSFIACDNDDDDDNDPDPIVRYEQEDQMGRPGISTVFVSAADKDTYNTTIASWKISLASSTEPLLFKIND